jgi:hypothetical protein
MERMIEKIGEEALKAGGGLAVLFALIGGALAWPKGACDSLAQPIVEKCHNAFGELAVGQTAEHFGYVVGWAAIGAVVGAGIAFGLVQMGLFSKDELGINE